MATIKLGSTKTGAKLINYAEKRAEVKQGVDCSDEYAKTQMKATREMWSKTDGIQAHHVIQSFNPEDDVSPEQANDIGRELAGKIAKDHEAVVYTHTDKDHTHNHIVINAINYQSGKKYQSNKKNLYRIREASDELCRQRDLSVVEEHTAETRYTLAEYQMAQKEQPSWKDDIRYAIEQIKPYATNFDTFKERLRQDYGVEAKLRGKTLSYKHPGQQRFVRAKKLGADYEMEGLSRDFARQSRARAGSDRAAPGDQGTERADEGLHQRSHGQGRDTGYERSKSAGEDQNQQRPNYPRHAVNLGEARKDIGKQQRKLRTDVEGWAKPAEQNQQQDSKSRQQHEREQQRESESNERQHARSHKKNRRRSKGLSL